MQSMFPNGAPLPLLLGVAAVFAYFCGCFNGAVIVSKYILRDDVRNHGSGNAGLTNFFRTFGGPLTFVVILCDVLKAVVALLVSSMADVQRLYRSSSPQTLPWRIGTPSPNTGRVCSACWAICSPACSSSRAARASSPAAPWPL